MPSKSSSSFVCRIKLRQDSRRRLDEAARKHGVSETQEMAARLERSLADPESDPLVRLTASINRLLALHGEKASA